MAKLILKLLLAVGAFQNDDPIAETLRDESKGAMINIITYFLLLMILLGLSFSGSMNILGLYFAGLAIIPAMLIAIIRLMFTKEIIKKDDSDLGKSAYLIKKYNYVNLNRYKLTFALLAYLVSFSFFYVVWNYREYEEKLNITLTDMVFDDDTEHEAPITQHQPPPPPPPVVEIQTVPEEEIIEEEPEIEEVEMEEEEEVEEIIEEEPEEEEEEVFMIVEDMPEFPNGPMAMMKFLRDNIVYPRIAIDNDLQGTVIVQFVVAKDGHINNVSVVRGIGGGCDEEAVRVIKKMPNWNPGKQRGRAVPVNIRVPVRFKLS